jgi:hypothetical protein
MPPPADVNIDDYGCGTQLSVWCARCGKKTATVRFLLRAWANFARLCRNLPSEPSLKTRTSSQCPIRVQ